MQEGYTREGRLDLKMDIGLRADLEQVTLRSYQAAY